MTARKKKFVAGAIVIGAALAYMIYAGVTQSAVYFVTPTELETQPVAGKAYRVGGMVVKGSLSWQPRTLELAFALTDGKTTSPIRHKGTPPDLFGEGRGAVVEGTWNGDGYFKASTILAKHSEEYKAPSGTGGQAPLQDLVKTLEADR